MTLAWLHHFCQQWWVFYPACWGLVVTCLQLAKWAEDTVEARRRKSRDH